ncbi:hypothetical protein [Clostridium saccharoperbutylacetonicum]|uniref:hypothetical protein n=1 Tax=Clostridium saccharoperbutylacetonicum TaxID=36745 RepID=UPI0039E9C3BA
MEGLSGGIILGIVLIVFLEIFRVFRNMSNSSREIDELKKRVNNIEELLENQNKF